MIISICELNTH